MIIGGMRKLSTLDYPTKLCVTVFTEGCNFRCPFCHNSALVLGSGEKLTENDIFSFLAKRKGIIDGVCLTGGEPLMQPYSEVASFLEKVKTEGFLVKLDTNGAFPEKLVSLIKSHLVDYVAMDIKNSPQMYGKTTGIDLDIEAIGESVAILMNGNVDFEFRTTVVRELHSVQNMVEIGKWLSGNEKYFLQMFVPSENVLCDGLTPYSKDELEELRQAVLPYVPNAKLRGV